MKEHRPVLFYQLEFSYMRLRKDLQLHFVADAVFFTQFNFQVLPQI